MPRKNLIRTNLYPYHVTSRCHNKDWFQIPLPDVWRHSLSSLKESHEKFPVDLVSFVLMGNHYHMILKTPRSDLDMFMREFNRRLSLRIQKQSGVLNQVFGGRYKWCLINSNSYLMNCYRYVYQNPVRAGIVPFCEDYHFSTLRNVISGRAFVGLNLNVLHKCKLPGT